jgi:hypothetical protein
MGELPIVPFRKFRVQLWRQQILSRLQGGAAFLLSEFRIEKLRCAVYLF